jgi:hypothetical protein
MDYIFLYMNSFTSMMNDDNSLNTIPSTVHVQEFLGEEGGVAKIPFRPIPSIIHKRFVLRTL